MCKLLLVLVLTLSSAGAAHAYPLGESTPRSYVIYMGDALLTRPFTLAATIVGAAVYAATFPLTFYAEDGTLVETLVIAPWDATFKRCIGCPLGESIRQD
ncbi:MAG: hypothetical protein V3T14_09390 [Myxococcota bacterium]